MSYFIEYYKRFSKQGTVEVGNVVYSEQADYARASYLPNRGTVVRTTATLVEVKFDNERLANKTFRFVKSDDKHLCKEEYNTYALITEEAGDKAVAQRAKESAIGTTQSKAVAVGEAITYNRGRGMTAANLQDKIDALVLLQAELVAAEAL